MNGAGDARLGMESHRRIGILEVADDADSLAPRGQKSFATSSSDFAPEHLSVDVEPLEPTVARLRTAPGLLTEVILRAPRPW